MSRVSPRFGAALLALALLSAAACTVTGVGVGYEGDYGGGFYEPYGYEYGGWAPGYSVGPPRFGDRRPPGPGRAYRAGRGGPGPNGGRPFRAAPPSRPMPGIPGRPRGR